MPILEKAPREVATDTPNSEKEPVSDFWGPLSTHLMASVPGPQPSPVPGLSLHVLGVVKGPRDAAGHLANPGSIELLLVLVPPSGSECDAVAQGGTAFCAKPCHTQPWGTGTIFFPSHRQCLLPGGQSSVLPSLGDKG